MILKYKHFNYQSFTLEKYWKNVDKTQFKKINWKRMKKAWNINWWKKDIILNKNIYI